MRIWCVPSCLLPKEFSFWDRSVLIESDKINPNTVKTLFESGSRTKLFRCCPRVGPHINSVYGRSALKCVKRLRCNNSLLQFWPKRPAWQRSFPSTSIVIILSYQKGVLLRFNQGLEVINQACKQSHHRHAMAILEERRGDVCAVC